MDCAKSIDCFLDGLSNFLFTSDVARDAEDASLQLGLEGLHVFGVDISNC